MMGAEFRHPDMKPTRGASSTDAYLLAKTVHVVSSTILFGTGIGSAFYLLRASLQGDARQAHFVARNVVVADFVFIAPAVVVQPLTGWYLARAAGLPFETPWISWAVALYVLGGVCWVPAVWLQVRMRDLAGAAAAGEGLPPEYRRCFRAWVALGIVAFAALLAVFWLMVAKPGAGV